MGLQAGLHLLARVGWAKVNGDIPPRWYRPGLVLDHRAIDQRCALYADFSRKTGLYYFLPVGLSGSCKSLSSARQDWLPDRCVGPVNS
jgi:hypothetical protein